ncbi:putative repeat protein (TIGR03943 family) [Natranaerovirga pectinivora]|uniref:Putative repeat protein (TIGR03943 family) n=1 Tax=Natranaerovirga pectinivora TaxID=682400 RepID=A0A4R3MPK6_9FIRM|nr:TIGR03943 family protein [Natranaerovirga pectinivora]TCT16762.1 putative repeat protein (TIGR03943 family) [Natranaerovirga pectinivora]
MKLDKKQPLNIYVVLQSTLIALFLCGFLYILYQGWILKYLHPRMIKYVWIAIFTFIGIIVAYLKNFLSFKKAGRMPYTYFVFLIPIGFMFFLPPVTLDSSFVQGSRINLYKNEKDNENNIEDKLSVKEDKKLLSNILQETPLRTYFLNEEDGYIIIEQENFYSSLMALHFSKNQYIGKSIVIEGFVYSDASFLENEFIISQFLMSCCVADVQLIGLICQYEEETEIQVDQWFRVEGILAEGEGLNNGMTMVVVEKMTSIDEPEHIYIYPY